MKYIKTFLALALVGFSFSAFSQNCTSPSMDGYTYSVVEIGDQCWFAENLRTTTYLNGDVIPAGLTDTEWTTTTLGATTVYGEGNSDCIEADPVINACDNVLSLQEYGRLYNWYAVDDARGLCPSGWHVPTDGEWTDLENHITSQGYSGTEGTALKSTSSITATGHGWYYGGNGTDDFGFSALPGGSRHHGSGHFASAVYYGNWWSSLPDGDNAWYRNLYSGNPGVYRDNTVPRYGFSVRCLRDATVLGCTDPAYLEYDAAANTDDGSCATLIPSACDDETACNYAETNIDAVCLEVDTVMVHIGGELDGLTTYRLYVKFPTDYIHLLTGVFGTNSDPLSIETTTSFYQNQIGGPTAEQQNPLLFPTFPNLVYDSYVTIGLTEAANLAAGESDPTLIASFDQDWITAFEAGGDIVMDDVLGGLWFILPPGSENLSDIPDFQSTQNDNNRVLVGQFTTDGTLSAAINIQVRVYDVNLGIVSLNAEYSINTDSPCQSSDPCVFPITDYVDCDGNCLNDADSDGICDEEEIAGCTDATACNYDADFTDDDGSCEFTSCIPVISGGLYSTSSPCASSTEVVVFDEEEYGTIEIGGICWFAEDLKTTTGINTETTTPTDWVSYKQNETPASTYFIDDVGEYYRSYNWYAVNQNSVCPSGWHVANNGDWNTLELQLFQAKGHRTSKATNLIAVDQTVLTDSEFFSGFNAGGFSGGLRDNVNGKWRDSKTSIYWWTAEEYNPKITELGRRANSAWARGYKDGVWGRYNDLWSTSNSKNNALRIRCVKN